jgi:tetratricopeptide (TPR) repeat protein
VKVVAALLDQAKWKEAEKAIAKHLPGIDADATRGALIRQRGRARLELGQVDAAQADLRQAMNLVPDLAVSYFDLSALFAGEGEEKKAFNALLMALRLDFVDIEAIRSESRYDKLRGNKSFKTLMDHFFHSPLAAEPDAAKRFKDAAKRLRAVFKREKDPYLRAEAALYFTEPGSYDATELLANLLNSDRVQVVRRSLAEVLGKTRDPEAVALLCERLVDKPKARTGQALVWALRDVPGLASTDAILQALGSKHDGVWQAAAAALGDRPDARAVEPLIARLAEAEDTPRVAALVNEALGKITGQDMQPVAQDWQNWFAAHGASLQVGPVHDPCSAKSARTVVIPGGFRDRRGKFRSRALKRLGGNANTERTVKAALDWLARHQDEDGRWNTDEWARRCDEKEAWEKVTKVRQRRWDVHVTGLALMAFLGAGHSHLTGDYQDTVRKGLDFLKKQQRKDGYIRGDQHHHHYSHACATTALVEAYLLTRDCKLKPVAEKAVEFIVTRQYRSGGWGWNRNESLTGPSAWNLMAINTAHLAGLRVPASSQVWIRTFLDKVTVNEGDETKKKPGFTYGKLAPNTLVGEGLSVEDHQEVPSGGSHLTTAMGAWVRLVLGQGTDDPRVAGGVGQIGARLPKPDAKGKMAANEWLFFASQSLILGGSKAWPDWNEALIEGLLGAVVREGCERGTWEPTNDRGRVHAVALGALTLECYYRFNLGPKD